MNCRLRSIAGYGLLLFAASIAVAQQAAPSERWANDIRKFEQADRKNPPAKGGVVFVGSSSIRQWPALSDAFPDVAVIQRGFGGSQMADAVAYVDRIVLPYEPRLVVVYAGDNDLASGKSPERVLDDYQQLVKKIHAQRPETRIAFLAIKPCLRRWNLIDRVRAANSLIKKASDRDERLVYIDVFTPLLGKDGKPRSELFQPDKLHLNAQGYRVWQAVVAPHL